MRTQQFNSTHLKCGVVQCADYDVTVQSKSLMGRNDWRALSLWTVTESNPNDSFPVPSCWIICSLTHGVYKCLLSVVSPSLLCIITTAFKILDAIAYWVMNQARNWPLKTLLAGRKWLSAWKSLHRRSLCPGNIAWNTVIYDALTFTSLVHLTLLPDRGKNIQRVILK